MRFPTDGQEPITDEPEDALKRSCLLHPSAREIAVE